jgi:hypothetical protein
MLFRALGSVELIGLWSIFLSLVEVPVFYFNTHRIAFARFKFARLPLARMLWYVRLS